MDKGISCILQLGPMTVWRMPVLPLTLSVLAVVLLAFVERPV